jgi:hypothetical protein
VTSIALRKAPILAIFAFTFLVNTVCFGQAMDDPNFQVLDYEILEASVGTNDVLPAGPKLFSLVSYPEIGTFQWTNETSGAFQYEVEPILFQTHDRDTQIFNYQVCVGNICDTATIEIYILFRNDIPFANNDTLYVETGSTRWGDVTPNDGDPDSISDPNRGPYTSHPLSTPVPPSYADFTVTPIDSFPKTNGTFQYKPLGNFIGEDYFLYYRMEPYDCFFQSPPARVTIFVVPSNENPVAGDANIANAVEEQTVSYNLLPLTSDPENEVLYFALSGQPNGGMATINASGQLTYTSTNNFIGLDTVAYTVMDLVGQLDTGYVYIQVANGNNDAPLLTNSAANAQEDSPTNFSVATPDLVDGDVLTYQIVSTSALGNYTVGANGNVNYTPPTNYSGTDIIRYRACDTSGLCDTAAVVITIAPVNDAPIAGSDFNTTVINGTVSGLVNGNDSDIDNNANQLTYLLLDPALHGTASVQANGTYTYTPDPLYFGEDLFTYRVCDSQGLCDDADVVINVLYTNLPPSTQNSGTSVAEDDSVVINLSAVSSDFNGGDLTYSLISSSSFGTFAPIVNTGFNFAPSENLNGTFQIAYRVCDTGNLCDTAMLTIDITPVNDAPIVMPRTISVLEDTPVSWTATYWDVDSDNTTLTVEVLEYPQHGMLSGEFIYQGDANYFGEDAITFRVCDSEGACTESTHALMIEAVNDGPVATGETVTIMEDSGPDVIPLNNNDTDVEGDALQYTLLTEEGDHAINFSISGLMAISPAENFNGTITLDYAVCDGAGLCDTAKLFISVEAVNDLPQSAFPQLTTTEDTALSFDPSSYTSDIDGDQITYSIISSQGVAATFDPANQTYSLTPTTNFFGDASVVIQVCDGTIPCTTDTLHIQFDAVNDAPVVSDIEVFTFVNIPAEGELIGFVSDVDDLTFTASVENNSNGTLIIDSTLHFSYIPTADFLGINSLLLTVCDSSGLCDTAVFMIEVFPPNQAPQASGASFETCQAASVTIPVASLVSDDAEAAESLSYLFTSSAPAQIMVNSPATEAVILPSSFFSGIMMIDMVVCDNASPALCDTAQYTIEVVPSFTPEITAATIEQVSCNGANNGSIVISSTTDTTSPSFEWSNAGSGNSIEALAPGDYSVTILSSIPCSTSGTASFTINEPELLTASFTSTNISDNGNGTIDLIIAGGTAPYAVSWTGPQGYTSTTLSLIELESAGTYAGVITDANACTTSLEVVITSQQEYTKTSFSLYPNPAADNTIRIDLPAEMPLPCTYVLTDLSGKAVQEGLISGYSQQINLTDIAGGCYLLTIDGYSVRLMRQ